MAHVLVTTNYNDVDPNGVLKLSIHVSANGPDVNDGFGDAYDGFVMVSPEDTPADIRAKIRTDVENHVTGLGWVLESLLTHDFVRVTI